MRDDRGSRPVTRVLVTGPVLEAVSGVATHLRQLLAMPGVHGVAPVHFVTGSEGRAEARVARILRVLRDPFVLVRRIRRMRVDLVHLNTTFDRRAFARDWTLALAARAAGARVVMQVHGGQLPTTFVADRPLVAWAVRAFLRLADSVLVLRQSDVEDLARLMPVLRCRLVPNGVPVPAFTRPRLAEDAPLRMLFLGRLVHEKGVRALVPAMRELVRRGVSVVLTIAGDGPARESLARDVADADLHAVVTLAGVIHGDAKRALIDASDVIVLPGSATEGIPYALLEAMAGGCAPVVSPVGGVAETVRAPQECVFVPPDDAGAIADALTTLAANRDALLALQRAAHARVHAAYSVEAMYTATAAAYRAVASGERGAHMPRRRAA